MKLRRFTTVQVLLEIVGTGFLISSYLFVFYFGLNGGNNVFALILVTFLYLIVTFLAFFPQVSNICTSKKYSDETKDAMENRLRTGIQIAKIILTLLLEGKILFS